MGGVQGRREPTLLWVSADYFLPAQENACPNEITPPPPPRSPRHHIVSRTALVNR